MFYQCPYLLENLGAFFLHYFFIYNDLLRTLMIYHLKGLFLSFQKIIHGELFTKVMTAERVPEQLITFWGGCS